MTGANKPEAARKIEAVTIADNISVERNGKNYFLHITWKGDDHLIRNIHVSLDTKNRLLEEWFELQRPRRVKTDHSSIEKAFSDFQLYEMRRLITDCLKNDREAEAQKAEMRRAENRRNGQTGEADASFDHIVYSMKDAQAMILARDFHAQNPMPTTRSEYREWYWKKRKFIDDGLIQWEMEHPEAQPLRVEGPF